MTILQTRNRKTELEYFPKGKIKKKVDMRKLI